MKIKYDTDGKEINHSHRVVKKGVCGGTPIIKGTRTSVANVAGYYLMGLSPEEIQRELIHLSLAQIYSAGAVIGFRTNAKMKKSEPFPSLLDTWMQ